MNPENKSWTDLVKASSFVEGGILSRVIRKGKGFDYTLMCLAKGAEIDTHTSSKNAAIVVISGEGEFILEGKSLQMRPGVLIAMPPDAKHSLRASKDIVMLLILHS